MTLAIRARRGAPVAWRALTIAILASLSWSAQAALFGDDEARRAIVDLRTRVDANRQAAEESQRMAMGQQEEANATTRRALLDLANQIEAMRDELAQLRGQNEQLTRDVAEVQRRQKDVLGAVDERLRVLEPIKVSLDGQEFMAQPEEKAAYEGAMEVLRASQFPKAAQLFGQFLERYPSSGYAPLALYWQGNALYAARSYKPAIGSYQRLLNLAPEHLRTPEAKLAIANCQLELKDVAAAKATLQELVKTHPQTEAGATARDRLARLK